MQYLEIVTENVEAFRIPFNQIESFHLSNITESIHMDSNHELHTYKVAGSVSICISKVANRQLPYDEGYLFSRLMRWKDITSLEISSEPSKTTSKVPDDNHEDMVSYLVPWSDCDDMTNSLAKITQEDDGSLLIIITGQ